MLKTERKALGQIKSVTDHGFFFVLLHDDTRLFHCDNTLDNYEASTRAYLQKQNLGHLFWPVK